MQVLDREEENKIRNTLRDEASAKCSDQKAIFGQCVASAKIGTVFYCRKQMKEWNECLQSFNTEEEINRRIDEAIQKRKELYEKNRKS